MKNRIELMIQIDPVTSAPFRLIETLQTVNGTRSRVVDGAYHTLEEASAVMEEVRRRVYK